MPYGTRANRVATRTSTRPPPIPTSTPCPYRMRASVPDSVVKHHQGVATGFTRKDIDPNVTLVDVLLQAHYVIYSKRDVDIELNPHRFAVRKRRLSTARAAETVAGEGRQVGRYSNTAGRGNFACRVEGLVEDGAAFFIDGCR